MLSQLGFPQKQQNVVSGFPRPSGFGRGFFLSQKLTDVAAPTTQLGTRFGVTIMKSPLSLREWRIDFSLQVAKKQAVPLTLRTNAHGK